MNLTEIQAALAAPFTRIVGGKKIPSHKWKVQNFNGAKTKAMCVPFIDRGLVSERLNNVLGLNGWQFNVIEASDGAKIGTLSCLIDGAWIDRSDIGTASKTEAQKGSVSDALKRCASLFGVGAYLNTMQSRWLGVKAVGRSYMPVNKKGEVLYPEGLTNFLNGMSSEQGVLAELISAKPELWQKDEIKNLWNEFKL